MPSLALLWHRLRSLALTPRAVPPGTLADARTRGVFLEPWRGPAGELVIVAIGADGRLAARPFYVPASAPAELADAVALGWEAITDAEQRPGVRRARVPYFSAAPAPPRAAAPRVALADVPVHPGLADVREGDPRHRAHAPRAAR